MKRSLKILVPFVDRSENGPEEEHDDDIGTEIVFTAIGRRLLKRGHRVTYLIDDERYRGTFRRYGFDEIIASKRRSKPRNDCDLPLNSEISSAPDRRQAVPEQSVSLLHPIEKLQAAICRLLTSEQAKLRITAANEAIREAIEQTNPDLIVIDRYYLAPAISVSGVRWIRVVCGNPLIARLDDSLPPGGLGYSSRDTTIKSKWPMAKQAHRQLFYSKPFNDHLETLGYRRYANDAVMPLDDDDDDDDDRHRSAITIYAMPDELNYSSFGDNHDNDANNNNDDDEWFNLQSFESAAAIGRDESSSRGNDGEDNRHDHEEDEDTSTSVDIFESVPAMFMMDSLGGRFSGRWIYVSISGATANRADDLWRRLAATLATTSHKYIVRLPASAQCSANKDLPGNIFVASPAMPTIAAIRHVDLVITTGDHRTIVTTFVCGKPVIVIPLAWYQLDDAQRLHETGYGVRIDIERLLRLPSDDRELIDAIDRMLGDEELKRRLRDASARIRGSDSHRRLVRRIERLFDEDDADND